MPRLVNPDLAFVHPFPGGHWGAFIPSDGWGGRGLHVFRRQFAVEGSAVHFIDNKGANNLIPNSVYELAQKWEPVPEGGLAANALILADPMVGPYPGPEIRDFLRVMVALAAKFGITNEPQGQVQTLEGELRATKAHLEDMRKLTEQFMATRKK